MRLSCVMQRTTACDNMPSDSEVLSLPVDIHSKVVSNLAVGLSEPASPSRAKFPLAVHLALVNLEGHIYCD